MAESLLYKDEKDLIYEAIISKRNDSDNIQISFWADCGKFGTDEPLAEYNLTPKRLLEILNDRKDITDEEFELK